jgi:hypothetical protein
VDLAESDYLSIAAWAIVVLLLLPAVLGAVWARLSDARGERAMRVLSFFGLSTAKRTAEAWIWAFGEVERKNRGIWLKVRLKDGPTYFGKFGAASLASSDASTRDLYIEQWWELDDTENATSSEPTNSGVWIAGDQIMAVEFFPEEAKDERRAKGEHANRRVRRSSDG